MCVSDHPKADVTVSVGAFQILRRQVSPYLGAFQILRRQVSPYLWVFVRSSAQMSPYLWVCVRSFGDRCHHICECFRSYRDRFHYICGCVSDPLETDVTISVGVFLKNATCLVSALFEFTKTLANSTSGKKYLQMTCLYWHGDKRLQITLAFFFFFLFLV